MIPRRQSRSLHVLLRLCALLLHASHVAAWVRQDFKIPGPWVIYKTEPDFTPIKTDIKHFGDNRSAVQPGYIFIAPHIDTLGWGPHIIDEDGNLVWYGASTVRKIMGHYSYAMNFHVCDYMGQVGTHLCYSEARPHTADNNAGIKAVGANRIFNNNYEQVGEDYQAFADFPEPNPHEFVVFPGGQTMAQSVYYPRELDLTPYKGEKSGWALEGCIQEVDLESRKEIFKWCILDDQPIWNTDIFLDIEANTVNKSTPIGGKGGEHNKWDFIHLNAIDKDEEGNYLISGRHFDQIVKVAGPNNTWGLEPGKTIWKLGGKASDFEIDPEAVFSRQHDVRVIPGITSNEQYISLFNNAWDGHTMPSSESSSMKIIRVNNETMRVSLVNVYKHPKRRLAYAQGSARIMPNGNVYVGWGGIPEWSEFTRSGTLLSHSHAICEQQDKIENYRSLKFDWVGHPKTKPKLVAYCQTCIISQGIDKNKDGRFETGSPLIVYVSWNGATEVRSWRFYTSTGGENGPWAPAGTYAKDGFETKVHLNSIALTKLQFTPYVKVEALDESGRILESTYDKTFVPKRKLAKRCDAEGCFKPERFVYDHNFSQADTCELSIWRYLPSAILAFLVVLAIEMSDKYFLQRYMQNIVGLGLTLSKSTLNKEAGFEVGVKGS